MSRRVWTGLLVGLLAATALVAVGAGAYHAGEDRVVTVAPVAGAPGETVRVIGYGHWGHWGPPFGFLFPLLIIGLIVLLIAGRRRAYWGDHHHHPHGPGPWGGPFGPEGREAMLADWHRRAHGEAGANPGPANTAPPGPA
jgi:hypothetical protein